jgi:hypothetical protein
LKKEEEEEEVRRKGNSMWHLLPAIYVLFLNKGLHVHQFGSFKPTLSGLPFVRSSSDRTLQSVHWIHISLDMSRQQRQEVSSESSSSVLRLFLNFFICALCFCVYLSCKWHACFLFFRPRPSLICSKFSVVLGVTAVLTQISVKQADVLLFCLYSYSLCVRLRKFSKVFWVIPMCC